jgi:hypothetical protein
MNKSMPYIPNMLPNRCKEACIAVAPNLQGAVVINPDAENVFMDKIGDGDTAGEQLQLLVSFTQNELASDAMQLWEEKCLPFSVRNVPVADQLLQRGEPLRSDTDSPQKGAIATVSSLSINGHAKIVETVPNVRIEPEQGQPHVSGTEGTLISLQVERGRFHFRLANAEPQQTDSFQNLGRDDLVQLLGSTFCRWDAPAVSEKLAHLRESEAKTQTDWKQLLH